MTTLFENDLLLTQIGYVIQITAIEALFVLHFKRKPNFWIRLSLSLVLYFLLSILLPLTIANYIAGFRSVIVFLLSLVVLFFCFDASLADLFFCAIGALSVQNLAYNLIEITAIGFHAERNAVLYFALQLFLYALIYALAYFILVKKIKSVESVSIGRWNAMAIATGMIVIVYFLQFWLMVEGLDRIIICRIPFVCCCIMSLIIQFGFVQRTKLEEENAVMEQLFRKEEKQYEISKTNMEIMNMKCHDLKNQMEILKKLDAVPREELQDLQKVTELYDRQMNTGNKSLDVVLFEKAMLCERYDIEFTYMADGSGLKKMKTMDIVSLFGNALDNAIECVKNFKDREKRVIALTVQQNRQMNSIHIENYCEQQPASEHGVPVTTKTDRVNHGFGLKSMRHIAEKYNGNVVFQFKDQSFIVNILLPAL